MVGGGALFAGLGLAGLGSLGNIGKNTGKGNLSFADAGGSWQIGPNTLYTAIHVALLPSGKIFYFAGSDYNPTNQNGPFTAGLLDPITNTQVNIPLSEDLFCAGLCHLPNGNVLIAGGNLTYIDNSPNNQWHGLNVAYEFDITSESLVKVQSMAAGRWYPTLVTLDEKKVACFNGLDEFGCYNQLVEIYDRYSKTWSKSYNPTSNLVYRVGGCSTLPGAGVTTFGGANHGVAPGGISYYPRMHLMPNGLLALVGMNNVMYTWNPANGAWVVAGYMTDAVSRTYGTSVLLPLQNTAEEKGQILVAGGAPGAANLAMNSCLIIKPDDSNKLEKRFTASMTYPRIYVDSVILPNGKIMALGGSTYANIVGNAVKTPELFDPETETWSLLPPATVPRLYHSVSMLLPDGRVWTAGTSYTKLTHELRTEIFSPEYMFDTRPTISDSPTLIGGCGGTIIIKTPDAANISKVSLVKISSVTHFHNSDQRLIWLQIQSRDSNSLTVSAPINSKIAPPGYYLVHVLDNHGVPSMGASIRIA